MTERNLRRRASDRAEDRAARAATRGDIVAMWVAKGQAEAAHRRRTEWDAQRTDVGAPVSTG